MTKLKLCGLARICDIEAANRLNPEWFCFREKKQAVCRPCTGSETSRQTEQRDFPRRRLCK